MHLSLALLLAALAANISDGSLEKLAGAGQIQQNASVKASIEITIRAPVEKVWRLLTNVDDWPKWQPDISKAEINGPLQTGTTFAWITGGSTIKSRLALVVANQKLAWTGTAFGAKAIHVWSLQSTSDKNTIVKTDESMTGFLLTLFYSSKKLEDSDRRWLDNLKLAAEH